MKFRKTRFIIFGARSWDDYRPNYVVLIFLPLKKFDSEHNLYEASFFEEVGLRPQSVRGFFLRRSSTQTARCTRFLSSKKFDSDHNLYEVSFFEEVQLRPQDSENRGRLHIKTVCCYF